MAKDIGGSRLGELIRSRRLMAGTQEDPMTTSRLAQLVGTHQTTVSLWENGRTKTIKPEEANALAKVLPLTVEELLRAMGYDLLPPRGLPKWLSGDDVAQERMVLQTANEFEQEAILITLNGLLNRRQGKRLPGETEGAPEGGGQPPQPPA